MTNFMEFRLFTNSSTLIAESWMLRMKAYLDIETSFGGEITVIGIFCPPGRMIQLVVEEHLGIERVSQGIDGLAAMRLWEQFRLYGDEKALSALLEYNREDVVNLCHLEAILQGIAPQGKKGSRD